MAEYRTIRMAFWNDPYIESLSAGGKLLYLYLFTCPHANNLGLLEITRRKIAFESGLSPEDVDALMADMERAGKIVTDGNAIWLVNFIKNQTAVSHKMVAGLRALFKGIGSPKIRACVAERYPRLFPPADTRSGETAGATDSPDTLPEGRDTPGTHLEETDTFSKDTDTPSKGIVRGKASGIPVPELEEEEEKEEEEEEEGKNARTRAGAPPSPPPEEKFLAFARRFQNEVTLVYGNTAPKVTAQLVEDGARELDRAVRLDGFDWPELQQALIWATTDDFWGKNLLSLARMRTKTRAGITKLQSVVAEYRRRREPDAGRFMIN